MMMKSLLFLASCAPLLSVAVDLPALPANIEVDIIFPRNETYTPVDNFPIILAIQNAALAWDFGFHISWDLRNLSSRSSSSFVDSESLLQSNSPKVAAPADTFFIANSTADLGARYQEGFGTYRLSWGFTLSQNCTRSGDFINHTIGAALATGELIFTIADGGKAVDLRDGGPCPSSGQAVGVQSNLTGCAHIDNTGIQANPCNIVVDDSLASRLSSQLPPITVSTSSASTAPQTKSAASVTSSTSNSKTSSSTTSATSNHAPNRGSLQTAAAVLAGAAGVCVMLV